MTTAGPAPTRPLRVLFVSREYPPFTTGGGIGSYVKTMAHALAGRGHEVHVLSCSEGRRDDNHLDDGVRVHLRGVPRLAPMIGRRFPGTLRRLEGAFARYQACRQLGIEFDVVEAPDWLAEGLFFGLIGTRPLVAHLHTPLAFVERHNPRSFHWTADATFSDRLEQVAVRCADVVTSPSRLLAQDVASSRWGGVDNPRIVRYPIDVADWPVRKQAGMGPPRILVVGRLEGRKAPEVLVEAAATLRRDVDGLEVVFIGMSSLHDGEPYRDWLERLARGFDAPCRFIEQISHEQLPTWFASARVVALPSRYDNFPYAGLEGMASARPLVCTDRTGVAELIRGTGAGDVVPADDPVALAAALRPFLLDGPLADRAGAEARAIVERECAPDEICEQRERCYRDAIALHAAGRRRHVLPLGRAR
ncbi:MAG TPA: glycosyltransferase family 4 protein [Gaiellaceae bacterium]|nr:glycosyltransferase family 4 protein [Gaiellaceae bacterium]